MAQIDEPLQESAPLAWQLAPQLCRKNSAAGEDCSAAHSVWQYLRILGLAGSIGERADFYSQALKPGADGKDAPRVLISGAADYAMLACLLAAPRARGAEPRITVIDLCETPLALNRWYAERKASRIETVCRDILEYQAPESFDVVCTDGFFGRFPLARRPALVAKWRELLRTGGRLITTNRLRPGSTGQRIGFSPEQALTFRDSVLRAIEGKKDALQVDLQELTRRAEIYAGRHGTYPVGSLEEIRKLFEDADFRIDTLAEIIRPGERRDGTNGPSIRGSEMKHLQLVASRP